MAWRGENIRLVKCSDDLTPAELSALQAGFNSDENYTLGIGGLSLSFAVEEWGGSASDKPELLEGTRKFFLANGALCARGVFTSHDPGLARIKMAVGVTSWQLEGLEDLPQSLRISLTQKLQLLQHQFLAGWMTLSDPELTELPLGGDGPNDANNPLGSGVLNTFFADSVYYGKDPKHYNDGVLKVKVTGTLPVKGLGTIKMPDQFPALAAAYATDANPDNENPSNRWDIHDESALESFATEGHPLAGTYCDPPSRPVNLPAGVLDAVDNCDGGYAFSRVFDADGPGPIAPDFLGLTGDDTVGPFDPQRPQETFLPDGRLTADDAPMPSARINFTIDQNDDLLKPVKDQKDISGVGSLHKTDKSKLYSADRKPNTNQGSGDDDPHNLYAPFYSAYVPATGAPEAHASGTDGLPGNSFTGYLVGDGLGGEGDPDDDNLEYDYWDIAHEYTGRTLNSVYTQCLRRNDEGYNKDNLHPYRMTPEGPQKVAIYTDEHGIGHVNFRPGSGFWFNALMNTQPDLGGNANGGCDLKYLKDSVLGYSDITASSHYPNQPVSGNPEGTATIRKTVKSLFAKYLAVYPKGTTADLRNARIVVAHAQDIDGSPFANEVVCFVNTTKGNDGVTPFMPTPQNGKQKVIGGKYDVSGTEVVDDPDNPKNSQRICLRTNDYGNAAVEVLESQGAEVNIIGDFTAEGILRDVKIPFGSPSLDPIDPGAPGRPVGGSGAPITPPAPGVAGNTTPTAQTLAVLAANNVQVSSSRTRRAARASVRFARVVNSARGTRYLSVRLQGRASRAQIRIQLVGYNGKTIRTVRRTVAVGRTVRLRNVRLGANVANARVSIIR